MRYHMDAENWTWSFRKAAGALLTSHLALQPSFSDLLMISLKKESSFKQLYETTICCYYIRNKFIVLKLKIIVC